MKALKIQIYQPTTHYRMPFTYQRRHTYPIPPYSTVFGFLCNMLGIEYQGNELYEKLQNCKLSVSGKFDIKLTEYIWFRNLSKSSHEKYFGSINVREKNSEVNHIGGQSPMRIDVLENMRLNLHIAYENESFLFELKDYLHDPVNRLETIHLGRAEDWLMFEKIEVVDLKSSSKDKNYNHFFWIPREIWCPEIKVFEFEKVDGLFYNIPTFVKINNYEKTFNRHAERSFTYMRSKLNDGAIIGLNYLYDEKSDIPVFFADLNKSQ